MVKFDFVHLEEIGTWFFHPVRHYLTLYDVHVIMVDSVISERVPSLIIDVALYDIIRVSTRIHERVDVR